MKNKAAPSSDLTPRNLRPRDFAHYRELWRAAEDREILPAYPLHLDLELTSHCNLRCRMCWQSKDINTNKGFMDDGLFKRLIDDGVGKGLASIKLQLRGESVLHPRVAGLTSYAKDAGVLDVQITTNGTVFASRPGLIEELIEAGLDKIVFSIDPQHDESALEIYGPDNQPDAAQAFRDTIEARRAMGRNRPLVRVQTIVQDGQPPEQRLGEVKALFADADEYFINPLWDSTWDEDALPGLATDYEFLPCTHLWTRLAVYWDGRAFCAFAITTSAFPWAMPIAKASKTSGLEKPWPVCAAPTWKAGGIRSNSAAIATCAPGRKKAYPGPGPYGCKRMTLNAPA